MYVQALSESVHILMVIFPLSTLASFVPFSSFQHIYFSVFLDMGMFSDFYLSVFILLQSLCCLLVEAHL